MESADESGAASSEKKATGACASCHRRKLKCDRMPVCSNCRKADIPCVYTAHPNKTSHASTTRDGRKKVRGPYNKGRTVREKELEHVVELLQEKCTILEAQVNSSDKTSPGSSHGSTARSHNRSSSTPAHVDHITQPFISFQSPLSNDSTNTTESIHPPASQILELWLIYTTTVDPMTKLLHCPTFTPILLEATKTPTNLPLETESLLLSIYIASLIALEPDEVTARFSHHKETLMTRYSTPLTHLLTTADGSGTLSFETLQALIIYMSALRRQSGTGENITSLFSLAVRSARALGLDRAVTYLTLSPLDAELRRRAWWTICRHESAYAEEIHTRKQSIMYDCDVPLPRNLDDGDIDAAMTVMQMPAERVGVTGMSFVLLMMEFVRLVAALSRLINGGGAGGGLGVGGGGGVGVGVGIGMVGGVHTGTHAHVRSKCLKEQSRRLVEETRTRMDTGTLQYCDVSRPFDWLLLVITKVLLTKVEVMLLSCSPDSDTTAINAFHDIKVALSLDIIECHLLLAKDVKMRPWRWIYRNTQQWYSMIYVLEEVARRPDAAFANRVWLVVDDVFADTDVLNKHGMKFKDRDKMLEAYGRAIEARETLLNRRDAAIGPSGLTFEMPEGGFGIAGNAGVMPGYPETARSEPWQMDQSLFDVQEAELDFDAFFWPS